MSYQIFLITTLLLCTAVVLLPTTMTLGSTLTNEECITSQDDNDGDGIPNKWERNGIDINQDGIIDLNLQQLEGSPLHKDLFLEIDYMQNHKPYSTVISDLVDTFKNAPLCNPDGDTGINLHVELDDEIPHQPSLDLYEGLNVHFNDFNKIKDQFFGTIDQRTDQNSENILDAKKILYHYGLFIHTFNDEDYSGIAKDIPSMDFVVSLGKDGNWPFNPNIKHTTGTATQQKGTLIHEFGHTIGLGHGGIDGDNYKPNYLSRMNYHFQLESINQYPLDYSHTILNSLNENVLNEPLGLENSIPPGLKSKFYVDCSTPIILPVFAGQSVNWNNDLDEDDIDVKRNINCDSNAFRLPAYSTLNSYDDWNNLVYIDPSVHLAITTGSTIPLNTTYTITELTSGSNAMDLQTQNNTSNGNNTISSSPSITSTIDEMTSDDLRLQMLGIVAGINKYLDNVSNSSFKVPIVDPEGNLIESDTFIDKAEPASLGKGYYNKILGDPASNITEPFVGLDDDDNIGSPGTVADAIKVGNVDLAIMKLENQILNTADSSFGGLANNDFIKDPKIQRELAQLVTSGVEFLKAQTCTYDECE